MEEPIVEMTAVETLIHMLFVKKMINEVNYNHTEAEELREIFDFANEIFKEQIIKARITAPLLPSIDKEDYSKEAQEYFNKTFKLK